MQQNYIGNSGFSIEAVLSPTEKQYYEQLFGYCTKDGNFTDQSMLPNVLKGTLLEKKVLADVWGKYCTSFTQGAPGLNKLQFFTLMRAIALYQANIPPQGHDQYLLMRNFTYLPKFEKVPLPAIPMPTTHETNVATLPPIGPQELQMYEGMINQAITQSPGVLTGAEAKPVLTQSGLPKPALSQIWTLCDRPGPTGQAKGFLNKSEWILCLHLISKAKLGVPVPSQIPPEMAVFLQNYQQAYQQGSSGVSPNSISMSQPGATSYQPPQTVLRPSPSLPTTPNYVQPGQQPGMPAQPYQQTQSIGSYQPTQPPQYQPAQVQPPQPYTPAASFPSPSVAASAVSSAAVVQTAERAIGSLKTQTKKFSDEIANFNEVLRKSEEESRSIREQINQELAGLQQDLEQNQALKQQLVQLISPESLQSAQGALSQLARVILYDDTVQRIQQVIGNIPNLPPRDAAPPAQQTFLPQITANDFDVPAPTYTSNMASQPTQQATAQPAEDEDLF